MNKALLHPDVQQFLRENLHLDVAKLILKGSPFSEISPQELATQLSGLAKAEHKLPLFFNNKKIVYPPKLNLEQTSSELTARYKSSLVTGKTLIDITGGFGIDSYFFSEKIAEITHVERNKQLSELAAHNFKALNAHNIHCVKGDGIEYLKATPQYFDWIYIDPSRRDTTGSRFFFLNECEPNVPDNLDFLKKKSEKILIKSSPLLDIKAGIQELKTVSEVHIVAVNRDVKELLWIIEKKPSSKIRIKTIDFQKKQTQEFETDFNESLPSTEYSLPKEYLFEPNPAIMKSGLFAEVALKTGTAKLNENSHLYTSKELKDFPGRRFEILKILPYNKKLKKLLGLKKANLTTRNFPKTVEELRKELKIKEGGKDYIFFTTQMDGQKIAILCRKITD